MNQNNTYEICAIDSDLLCELSNCSENELNSVNKINLHLNDKRILYNDDSEQFMMQKIRKITNLHLVPNLRYLRLSHNIISKIEGFDKLAYLLELNLAENSIKTIENLNTLINLEKLNLNGNQISRIPFSVSNLHKLTILKVARNKLNTLDDLENLSNLKYLTDLTINDNSYNEVCYAVNKLSSPWYVYQMHAIDLIPSLTRLDSKEVSAEHRRGLVNWTTPRAAHDVNNYQSSNNNTSPPTEVLLDDIHTTINMNSGRQFAVHEPDSQPRMNQLPTPVISPAVLQTPLRLPPLGAQTFHGNNVAANTINESASKTVSSLQHRLEVMTTKLLTADREKTALQTELTAIKATQQTAAASVITSYSNQAKDLAEQLEDSERRLRESADREEALTRQLVSRMSENEALSLECEKHVLQLTALRDEVKHVTGERDRLNDEMRSLRESLLEKNTSLTVQAAKRLSALDEWRAGETRKEILTDRVDVDELRLLTERQQRDLESAMKELSAANQTISELRVQLDKSSSKLSQSEESGRVCRNRVLELETEARTMLIAQRELAERATVAEEERYEFKAQFERADADIRAYLQMPQSSSKTKNRRNGGSRGKLHSSDRYLDSMSTDSEESPSPDPRDTDDSPHPNQKQRQSFSSPLSRNMPGRFSLTVLEQKAAEIMAQMLAEELHKRGDKGVLSEYTTSAGLKEACSIVALRLLHTSVGVVRSEEEEGGLNEGDNHAHDAAGTPVGSKSVSRKLYRHKTHPGGALFQQVPISPFHVLGDRRYLTRLVTETQEGIASIEDARSLQREVKQLQKLIEEREKTADIIQRDIAEKHQVLSGLKIHCEEARSKANETLDELALLAKRLQAGRDDITSVESEFALARRELELSNSRLREARAMTQLEDKNLLQLRAKLAETKDLQSTTEEQLLLSKELLLKEEDKLRKTTNYSTQQLRQLQADLHRFETDFKAKQRTKEDVEKQQRLAAEEHDLRRRDAEASLAAISRQHEEEHRKLHSVKEEISVAHLERDLLVSQRRKLENELAQMEETMGGLTSRFTSEDVEARRKLEAFDRKVLNQEKRIRANKSNITTLEGEQTVLRASIDELQRQLTELERSNEAKRRVADEELGLLKNHAQLALREANQRKADSDHLRVEIETLTSEKNTVERQRDAAKRALHEHDMLLDSRRDALRACELEKERVLQDSSQLKKSDDSLAHQHQMVKSELEVDRRLLEDGRRKLAQWREEEASIRESQTRLRNSYALKSKELDDLRAKLDVVNAQCEREKRELMDARTKKSLVEGDLHRLEEEVKCAAERNNEEGIRKVETEAALRKIIDELNRLTREVVNKEKQIGDARRVEEDLRHREQELKLSQERIRVETETHKAAIQNERSLVDRLQDEHRQLSSETRQVGEENKRLRQELDRNKIGVESSKSQHARLEQVKDELSAEIHALRETSRQELVRTEALEKVYGQVESRLHRLREDLQRAEGEAQKSRSQGAEEEHRVAEQRRVLRLSMDELARIQTSISDANKQLHEERQKAVFEISQLGHAKQSANAHMFLVAEAGKRQDKLGKTPSQPEKAHAIPDRYSHSTSLDSRYPLYTVCSTTALPVIAPPIPAKTNNYFEPFSRVAASHATAVDGVVVSSVGPRMADAELSTLQRELEALRSQSSAVLSSATTFK